MRRLGTWEHRCGSVRGRSVEGVGARAGAAVDEAAVRAAIARAARELAASGRPDEALAEYVPAHRMFGFIPRQSTMKPIGRVWRLGVLLIARDGSLHLAGQTTRAVAPGWANNQSRSAEERREYRAAAHRGPFRDGEVVNFDAEPVALDAESIQRRTTRLHLDDGELLVRWGGPGSTGIRFADYLCEQLDLVLHPPGGA